MFIVEFNNNPVSQTLLVANLTRINMLPIASNKDTLDTVLTSQPKNLRSIDVDIMRNIVYWSEIPGTLKLLQVTLFKVWKLLKKKKDLEAPSLPQNPTIPIISTCSSCFISEGNKESAVIWQLDMATRKTEKVVSTDIKQPNSIAVDWNAQNLYWLDAGDEGKGTLEVVYYRPPLKNKFILRFKTDPSHSEMHTGDKPLISFLKITFCLHDLYHSAGDISS